MEDIAEGPVTIEADSISYNEDEDTVHAAGKVVITFTRGFLKADNVTLYRETNLALAEGHVLIHSDQDVLEGEKVLFNIDSRTGTVDQREDVHCPEPSVRQGREDREEGGVDLSAGKRHGDHLRRRYARLEPGGK